MKDWPLLSADSLYLPIGENIPISINIISKVKSMGVRMFPIVSTTRDGRMVKSQVRIKNITEVKIGSDPGNDGKTPIS
ncbi:hypothetical protein D3C87_1665710 [compost metagenome]